MSEASTTSFVIYHLHYKDKLIGNPNLTFYTINYLYFLFDLSNFLTIFFFIYDGSVCIIEPSLVTKKRELLKTFLNLFSHFF